MNQGTDPDLHFWRDIAGHEGDFIIEQGQTLVPIEVKSGETITGDYLSGIEHWRGLPGQQETPAVVVYGGDISMMRSQAAFYAWKDWL